MENTTTKISAREGTEEVEIDLEKFMDGAIEWIRREVYTPLKGRIEALEKEVEALQERGALKYCGTFKAGTDYEKGDAITYGGSLWVALNDTTAEPPGPDWCLAAKKGKDGR